MAVRKVNMAGTVITIGTFDGVHLGHQAALRQTAELSSEQNLASIAYTFPFPQNQINPCLLLPQSIKVKLLSEYVDQVITTEFPTIQDLSPKQFFDEIIIKQDVKIDLTRSVAKGFDTPQIIFFFFQFKNLLPLNCNRSFFVETFFISD